MNKLQSIPLLLLALALACCDLLDSKPDDPLPPGRRDYTWRVDTLHSPPGGFVNDIWGSSPDNVWAVLETGLNNLWHFDGLEWAVWPNRVGPSFFSIYGFGPDNVWMGGNDGKIYHFDGEEWIQAFRYQPEGYRSADIRDIWGSSPSNIFAVGTATPDDGPFLVSFILHYNGDTWRELQITDFYVSFNRVRKDNEKLIIHATKLSFSADPDTLLIYNFIENSLQEAWAKPRDEVRTFWINSIGKRTYYIVDNNLKISQLGYLKTVLSFPDVKDLVSIDGRHENDLFIHTWSEVLHYDGQTVITLLKGLPRNVFRAQLFPEEIFFTIRNYNDGTNLIYHGILKQQED